MRILVIGDDIEYLEMLQKQYDHFIDVEITNSFVDGFTKAKRKKYDIVYVDARLPVVSGCEMIEHLTTTADIYLFSVSGVTENDIKDGCRDKIKGTLTRGQLDKHLRQEFRNRSLDKKNKIS